MMQDIPTEDDKLVQDVLKSFNQTQYVFPSINRSGRNRSVFVTVIYN